MDFIKARQARGGEYVFHAGWSCNSVPDPIRSGLVSLDPRISWVKIFGLKKKIEFKMLLFPKFHLLAIQIELLRC